MALVTQRFIPGPRLIDGSDLNSMIGQINQGQGLGSGVTYYVNETIGNDGGAGSSSTSTVVGSNSGLNPAFPLKTLGAALTLERVALAKAGLSSVGRNSVVAFWGTQHRTSTLAWNLPATHLVGIGSSERRGKRARISVSGTTAFNNLVLVSVSGCQFANFGTFFGFAVSTNAFTPWTDTGGRNCYDNVEFLGFGDSTVTTGTANLTGARSFILNTSTGETSWYNCVFGVDTIQRGAANYGLEIAGGAPRCYLENCSFESDLAAGGTAGSHLLVAAAGIDRYLLFRGCDFMNFLGASAMSQAFNVDAAAGGTVLLDQCTFTGATAIQTAPTANCKMNMVLSTTGGGLAHTVF